MSRFQDKEVVSDSWDSYDVTCHENIPEDIKPEVTCQDSDTSNASSSNITFESEQNSNECINIMFEKVMHDHYWEEWEKVNAAATIFNAETERINAALLTPPDESKVNEVGVVRNDSLFNHNKEIQEDNQGSINLEINSGDTHNESIASESDLPETRIEKLERIVKLGVTKEGKPHLKAKLSKPPISPVRSTFTTVPSVKTSIPSPGISVIDHGNNTQEDNQYSDLIGIDIDDVLPVFSVFSPKDLRKIGRSLKVFRKKRMLLHKIKSRAIKSNRQMQIPCIFSSRKTGLLSKVPMLADMVLFRKIANLQFEDLKNFNDNNFVSALLAKIREIKKGKILSVQELIKAAKTTVKRYGDASDAWEPIYNYVELRCRKMEKEMYDIIGKMCKQITSDLRPVVEVDPML